MDTPPKVEYVECVVQHGTNGIVEYSEVKQCGIIYLKTNKQMTTLSGTITQAFGVRVDNKNHATNTQSQSK